MQAIAKRGLLPAHPGKELSLAYYNREVEGGSHERPGPAHRMGSLA